MKFKPGDKVVCIVAHDSIPIDIPKFTVGNVYEVAHIYYGGRYIAVAQDDRGLPGSWIVESFIPYSKIAEALYEVQNR